MGLTNDIKRRLSVTDNGYVDYISRQGAILALILLYSI